MNLTIDEKIKYLNRLLIDNPSSSIFFIFVAGIFIIIIVLIITFITLEAIHKKRVN